jgi:hypothetical protein
MTPLWEDANMVIPLIIKTPVVQMAFNHTIEGAYADPTFIQSLTGQPVPIDYEIHVLFSDSHHHYSNMRPINDNYREARCYLAGTEYN